MKIALIGYGKMGHMIEKIAKDRGHEISVIIDADNEVDIDSKEFRKSDVAIEFTCPTSAVNNILKCFSAGVPVVCGTTGWMDSLPAVKSVCESGKGALFYSSNYSIGVNIFEAVSRYLTKIMNSYGQYTPCMEEVHHIHKLDHPSGTAITIAEEIIEASDKVKEWKEPAEGEDAPDPKEGTLYISHRREGKCRAYTPWYGIPRKTPSQSPTPPRVAKDLPSARSSPPNGSARNAASSRSAQLNSGRAKRDSSQ